MAQVQRGIFPATRHSILAAVQSDNSLEKARALDVITAAYWKPVYKHLRLRWNLNSADAQDLTQEFFARLIEKGFLDSYDSTKGRLRTFLRTSVDRLYWKQSRDAHRAKRGGSDPDIHLDIDEAERELARTAFANADNVEMHFEREWIRTLFSLAVERLRGTYAGSRKMICFHLFERYDLVEDDTSRASYAQLAVEFGISVTNVTNYLNAARRQFRQCVLDQLREMTVSEEDFRCEARALLGVNTE
jgi:RNA polymerase sigma factor (sigma-70 family)